MLTLTLPTTPDPDADLAADPRVLQVLALCGGYDHDQIDRSVEQILRASAVKR